VRTELRIAANGRDQTISRFLAEAGINLALFRLLEEPPPDVSEEEEDFRQGQIHEEHLPTGRVRYSAVNESGKINLQVVPRELLELFLLHHGLENQEVEIVSDSLLDWQDPDDLHRLHGAEADFYLNLEEPYHPRNGPIQDPAEFFLVRGTGPLQGRFAPEDVFTVHNPGGRINFNSLTPAMLDFLVAGDQLGKQAYREAQALHAALDEEMAREILGEERFELLRDFLTYESGRWNPYYTVEAIGEALSLAEEHAGDGELSRERPGVRIKARVRVIGSVIHYLSWTEERV
jgi:general secretion pathway protein K